MDTSYRENIIKEEATLNVTLDQMDLIDIFTSFHSNSAEYTFFSSAHETFFQDTPYAKKQNI